MHPDKNYKPKSYMTDEQRRNLKCHIENMTSCGLSFNEMMKELENG